MTVTLELVVASLSGGLACWGLGLLVARRLRARRDRLPAEASHGVALPDERGEGVTLRGRLAARASVERCDDGGAAALQTVAARRGRFDHPHYPRPAVTTRGEGLALRVGEVEVELAEPCAVARGSRERTSSWSLGRLAPAVQHRVAIAATSEQALALARRRVVFRSLQAGDEVLASGTLRQLPSDAGYRRSAHRWVLGGVQLFYTGVSRRALGLRSLVAGAVAAILICGGVGYGYGRLVASSAQRRIWGEARPRDAEAMLPRQPQRTAELFSPSMMVSESTEAQAAPVPSCWEQTPESTRWICDCGRRWHDGWSRRIAQRDWTCPEGCDLWVRETDGSLRCVKWGKKKMSPSRT
jgi:hypothetical protein